MEFSCGQSTGSLHGQMYIMGSDTTEIGLLISLQHAFMLISTYLYCFLWQHVTETSEITWISSVNHGCGIDVCPIIYRMIFVLQMTQMCWIIGQQTIAEWNWNVLQEFWMKQTQMYVCTLKN